MGEGASPLLSTIVVLLFNCLLQQILRPCRPHHALDKRYRRCIAKVVELEDRPKRQPDVGNVGEGVREVLVSGLLSGGTNFKTSWLEIVHQPSVYNIRQM